MKKTNRSLTQQIPHHSLRRKILGGVYALVAVVAVGCAGGSNPDVSSAKPGPTEGTQSISGLSFEALQNGWIRSSQALSEIESANHYKLSFDLAPGGTLVFSANGILASDSSQINRGVEFEFRRSTDANVATLTVIGRASGAEKDWSEFFTSLDARQTVNIAIDIHNNEGDQSHLVAWGEGEEPIFESSMREAGGAPGRGFGTYWGFKLDQATLNSVAIEAPRDAH